MTELEILIEKVVDDYIIPDAPIEYDHNESGCWHSGFCDGLRAGIKHTIESPDILKAAGLVKKDELVSMAIDKGWKEEDIDYLKTLL